MPNHHLLRNSAAIPSLHCIWSTLVTTVRSAELWFLSIFHVPSLIYPLLLCLLTPSHLTGNGAGAVRAPEFATFVADIKDLRSDADQYTVKVDGEIDGINQLNLTFKQVRESFPRKEVLAALVVRARSTSSFREPVYNATQCAGNRRAKMAEKTGRRVEGINWSEGTIANVRWTGAPLRDILLRAGIPDDSASWEGLHACFASNIAPCDQATWYGGSIPLEKAMRKDGDVLLAYEVIQTTVTLL